MTAVTLDLPYAAAKERASIRIGNATQWAIHQLMLSPSDQVEWGPDQLGAETIEPGATFLLTGIDCDTYDVKLVDEDDDVCVVGNVDICADEFEWKITSKALLACQGFGAPGVDVRRTSEATVTIVNDSAWELEQLFLSPVDERSWGPDQLGADVLTPGERLTLTSIQCGTYDLKVVDEDGDVCVLEGVDLCADASVWHLTSRALLDCQE